MRRFLSICSGIESASVAFQPLRWEAVAFAEIEPFPCRVLAHHYPQVPNLGNLTRFREWDAELLAQADVLCGGTPCQAFSVAGLRGSLDDERGNLTLTFCHLYDHLDDLRIAAGRSPAVCLWENVPGIFSDKQNAFGCFLAALAGEGLPLQPPGGKWTDAGAVLGPRRAVAWRTLDAQYHGLAQRRRRVFVVASADPDFDPAAVLLEFDGVRRDSPPSRKAGESTAHELAPRLTSGGRGTERTGETRGQDCVIAEPLTARPYADNLSQEGRLVPENTDKETRRQGDSETVVFGGNNTAGPINTAPALNANRGCHNPGDFEAGALLVTGPLCSNGKAAGSATQQDAEQGMLITEVTHALRGEGFDASEDGTGRGTPIVPIAFPERLSGTQCAHAEDVAPVLQSVNPTAVAYPDEETRRQGDGESFAFDLRGREGGAMPEGPHPTVNLRAASGGSSRSYVAVKAESEGQRAESPEAVAFQPGNLRRGAGAAPSADTFPTLKSDHGRGLSDQQPHVAYTVHGTRDGTQTVATPTDTAGTGSEGTGSAVQNSSNTLALSPSPISDLPSPASTWAVRRLTPEECELLQGFPIGYTLLPDAKGKRKPDDLSDTIDYLVALGFPLEHARRVAATPDGPRYKALGNSWAVPCVRWIARRIESMLSNPNSLHPAP